MTLECYIKTKHYISSSSWLNTYITNNSLIIQHTHTYTQLIFPLHSSYKYRSSFVISCCRHWLFFDFHFFQSIFSHQNFFYLITTNSTRFFRKKMRRTSVCIDTKTTILFHYIWAFQHQISHQLNSSCHCIHEDICRLDCFYMMATKPSNWHPSEVADHQQWPIKLQQLWNDKFLTIDLVWYLHTHSIEQSVAKCQLCTSRSWTVIMYSTKNSCLSYTHMYSNWLLWWALKFVDKRLVG